MVTPTAKVNSSALIEKRRRQIVEGATLAFAQSGYANTGVKDIASYANVSVGLVYEYVRTKEDILFLVFEHWTNVWVSVLHEALDEGGNVVERIGAFTSTLVGLADRYRHVTNLFYNEIRHLTREAREVAKQAERPLIDMLSAMLREGMEKGYIAPDVKPIVVASNLLLLTHGWVLKSYVLHPEMSAEEYSRWVVGAMLSNAVTDRGRRALNQYLAS
jgi:AcrR family transcriptional regulator